MQHIWQSEKPLQDDYKSVRMTKTKNKCEDVDNTTNGPSDKEIINKDDEESAAEDTIKFNRKAMLMQVTMSILANLTILSSGLGLGFPAVTLQFLTNTTDSMSLDDDQVSWIASTSMICSPLGALISSYILDRIGRKYTLVLINLTSIISYGITSGASRTNVTTMYYELLIGRVIIGITGGMAGSPATIYAAEISNPKMRGRLSVLSVFAIEIGILIFYCFGYFLRNDWRFNTLICCGFSTVSLILLFLLPESPSWLLFKDRLEPAKKSLKVFRGLSSKNANHQLSLQKEIDQMSAQIKAKCEEQNEKDWRTLMRPEVYKPLFIMIAFFFFQQFSGIFVIVTYAAHFVIQAGVEMDPLLCTVFIGLTRVIATIMVSYVLDSIGRKPPCYVSGIGMTISMGGLAILAYLQITISWLSVFLILVHIFTSTIGFLILPFSMIAEVFPLKIRGLASGLTICAAFLMSFTIVKLYPTMATFMDNTYMFMFYGMISLIGTVFVWVFLPETKGKTLEEIEESFKKHSPNETVNTFKYKTDK